MELTALRLEKLKTKDKDYKLSDGKGLHILVRTTGSKLWRWSYRFNGKQKTMALGSYPEVSLKRARSLVMHYREQLAEGFDPKVILDSERAEATQTVPTFGDVVDAWFAFKTPSYSAKTIKRDLGLITNWIKPVLGKLPCNEVDATACLSLMREMERQGVIASAHKVISILSMVFRYGIADPSTPIDRNWVNDIKGLVKPEKVVHYPAVITPVGLAELLKTFNHARASFLTKMAFRVSLHTLLRPSEVRTLTWDNINWQNKTIELKADAMKQTSMTQDHWVPISRQLWTLLENLEERRKFSDYVFPSTKSPFEPMSAGTVNAMLKRIGYSKIQTAHGIRATARTIMEEELEINPTYIEHQLAHAVRDANGRAYNRTSLLEQRRTMMQTWADYLDMLEHCALNNLPIGSRFNQSTTPLNPPQ